MYSFIDIPFFFFLTMGELSKLQYCEWPFGKIEARQSPLRVASSMIHLSCNYVFITVRNVTPSLVSGAKGIDYLILHHCKRVCYYLLWLPDIENVEKIFNNQPC